MSRRTEPDSDDSFRITIDSAEVDVPGLDPASDNIKNYECSGKILTKEKFAKVIEEVKLLSISVIPRLTLADFIRIHGSSNGLGR